MLFQDVEQFATFNCVSHPSGSYYKLLFQNLKCSIWPSVPQFAELRPAYRACSTFREAVPHFWDAAPHKMELFHKKWNCSTLCLLLGYCPLLYPASAATDISSLKCFCILSVGRLMADCKAVLRKQILKETNLVFWFICTIKHIIE